MSERFSGNMRILRTGDSIANLGTMYRYNTEVLEQYVENGHDAGASKVWVILEKNRIAIFDNGHGLVPKMSGEDYDTLRAYKEDIDSGKMSGDIPFEVLFPELTDSPSLKSFQWMMECIGTSSKKISKDTGARGIKGLGAISFQQIANRAVWQSKPTPDLAQAYYKEDKDAAQNPPTAMLQSATAAEIRSQVLRYEIDEADPLKNPFLGKEVESGTLVELTELREGVERSLRPANVVRSLQARFGNDIRTGKMQIDVIDRVSDGPETLIEVPPSIFPGTLIYQEILALRGGRGPFEIELYYDPLGKGLYPKIARKGSQVSSIVSLEDDFNRLPWNSGRLSGLVSYPDLSDEEAPMDPQKHLPLPGPVYNQWKNRVEGVVEDIEKEIDKIDQAVKLGQMEEFSKTLGQEIVEAMREVPEFKDLVIKTRRPTPTRPPRPPKPEDRVIATVVNEHNDSVSGVRLELWKTAINELVKEAVTKKSGTVSLGKKMPHGRYRLKLAEIPPNAAIDGMDEYVFNLGVNQIGIRETFHLVNGEPKRPQPRPINQIRPFLHDWPNIDEPYIQRLELGVVEINTEGPELREVMSKNDVKGQEILCAQYMSSAAAEYVAAEDEAREDTLKSASRLFGVLVRRISSRKRRS